MSQDITILRIKSELNSDSCSSYGRVALPMDYEAHSRRNYRIYFEWIEGKEYGDLSSEFHLTKATIKKICTDLVPFPIKQKPGLCSNSYRRFREWKRKNLHLEQAQSNSIFPIEKPFNRK